MGGSPDVGSFSIGRRLDNLIEAPAESVRVRQGEVRGCFSSADCRNGIWMMRALNHVTILGQIISNLNFKGEVDGLSEGFTIQC